MDSYMEEEQELDLQKILSNVKIYLSFLLRKFHIILAGCVLGVLVAFAYYFLQKPKYDGTATFIMQEKSVASPASLSGLASQLGIDLSGSTSGGSLFAGENIIDILQSRYIISKSLLTGTNHAKRNQTLADLYLDFTGLKKKWSKKQLPIANVSFPYGTSIDSLTPMQDSVMQLIYKDVSSEKKLILERSNKKTTIIKVDVISANKSFAQALPRKMIEEATEFYISAKTKIIRANIQKLEAKSDSIVRILNNKTYTAASLRVNDPNPALTTLMVPVEVATRDKNILYTLYGEVIKNLEMNRTTLMQETPVIQILDAPGLTLYNGVKSYSVKIFAVIIFAFGVLTAGFLIVRLYLKKKLASQ